MQVSDELTVDDFDYALPRDLIAQRPLLDRAASRLLHVERDALHDLQFADLEELLSPGDLLVLNDTRVINARLQGIKPTGGKVEVLVERVVEPTLALAMVRTSHKPQRGAIFQFGEVQCAVEGRDDDLFLLRFSDDVHHVLRRQGSVPLPPYIEHAADGLDAERYQTVYAAAPGAVAAPTAGLHFNDAVLATLQARGVELAWLTLHVGAGTFQPVRTADLAQHRMHSERYRIERATVAAISRARAESRRIIAVGTTTLRALESAALASGEIEPGAGETRLFITPGFSFRVVDRLLTNFHLPRSTLLMLVSAFAGIDRIRAAYAHAIAQRYRFFSYGDAMLLERQQ